MKDKREIVEELVHTINKSQITRKDIIEVISQFLYSLGNSLENNKNLSSEEVLKAYATNPSLGNALMAQALWMKETWIETEKTDE